MASKKPENNADSAADAEHKMRLYILAAAALVILAAVSFILSPSASAGTKSRCSGLLFQQSRYNCIASAAVYSHNSSMCSGLPQSYSNYCYLGVATNSSDATLCGKINSTGLSNQCYIQMANRTGNAQICNMISGNTSSECFYMVALRNGSGAACSSVIGAGGQEQCNDTIIFNNALKTQDGTLCAKISSNDNTNMSDGILQNSSIGSHAQLGLNLSQFVDLSVFYNQPLGARDICYASVAYESLNKSYCSQIENSYFSGLCYSGLNESRTSSATNATANFTALYSTCAGSQAQIDACKYNYMSLEALQTGNLSICKSIPQNYSSTCFYYLAKKYNSTRYCGYISNATFSSACIGDIEGLYPGVNTSG